MNPDLIERAEHTPDTVVTLVDGHKLVVEEPVEAVIELVRTWRASVAAEAVTMVRMSAQNAPHTNALAAVLASPRHNTEGLDDDLQSAVIAERSAHGSPLGQILRLPSREV